MTASKASDLIALGLTHDDPRVRRSAEAVDRRVRSQLMRVEKSIKNAGERDTERSRRRAAIENTEKRIEQLTRDLADAKAKLRDLVGGNGPTRRSRASSRVRAWCREVGVDCPARGPIPKDVRAVYDFAHGYRSGGTR